MEGNKIVLEKRRKERNRYERTEKFPFMPHPCFL